MCEGGKLTSYTNVARLMSKKHDVASAMIQPTGSNNSIVPYVSSVAYPTICQTKILYVKSYAQQVRHEPYAMVGSTPNIDKCATKLI